VRSAVPEAALKSMRDVTRGGLNAVLHEYASAVGRTLRIEEDALPIGLGTRMAADMLGIDPINCANEGCLALFVDPAHADAVLDTLRAHPYGRAAVAIGEVTERQVQAVEMVGRDGAISEIEELRGAELPRLC
jgi:hydrogenase expression/formation protein HypE